MPPIAVAGGMAVAGGVAGAFGKNTSETTGINLNPASALQNQTMGGMQDAYGSLQSMVGAGPGQQDVTNAYGAQTGLAQMLQQYSQGGFLPTGSDFSTANNLAKSAFAPQQQLLQQSFQDATGRANANAAMMGRSGTDPSMQGALQTQLMRGQGALNAQQSALGQNLAMQMPGQRLGFASQRAGVLGGLASQALQNKQALLSTGSQLWGQQAGYQINTSQHYGNTSSGGGVGGAISGALSGAGAGLNAAGMMESMGAGGGIPTGGGMTPGYSQAASYFNGPNPYASGGAGFGGFGGGSSPSLFGDR